MQLLECDLDENMNTFALMPKDELDTILGAERDGKPWGIAAKGKIRRAFTAIKKAAGTEEPETQPTTTIVQHTGPAPATPPGVEDKVALNGVIIQEGEVKVNMMTNKDVDAAFAGYRARRGRNPAYHR